ncbi:MAG: STAS domain-containing protein [Planctomycetes bacterium]|nr:STAS domain-containing protein [Planctomycetota bacterium]
MDQELPRLNVTQEGPVTVVEFTDRKILDEISISRIGERLQGLVAKTDEPRLVLDFSTVGHMSSSALGMLITLHKHIREKKGQLRLCGIQPPIYEVFVITRLNEIFDISKTKEEALAAMS